MDGAAAHSYSPNDSTQETRTHLWIPDPVSRDSTSEARPSSSRAPQVLRERLYVGNLSGTVDEYALLQVFTKFGKVAKLDFLFHKSGPNKGRPRGYAFVEYMHEADAAKALQTANGRLLRGRKLVVTHAQQAPSHDSGCISYAGRNKRSDVTPTALSLAKSSGIARPEAKTSSKIAMMEAKLRQMAHSSSFADRPTLPSKPSRPLEGMSSARGSVRRMEGHGRVATLPSLPVAASSDLMGSLPSNKQRGLPGVKIVRGGGVHNYKGSFSGT